MVRPIVLVFQEFATQTVTPTTPDLNCLITGPAYQLQDYPVDKTDIEVSAYGDLEEDNPSTPPTANIPAITLAAPPNLVAGAWVEPSSIRVYFDEARVDMASGTDGVTSSSAPDENTLTSASATFQTDGIQAGDVLIIDNPAGPATPNLALTVISVDSETVLRVTSNFSTGASSLAYRVERELSDQEIDGSFVATPVFRASNEIDILGGVTLPVNGINRTVTYGRTFVGYRAYRTDLQGLDSINETADITTKVGRIDSRNPLAVGLSVAKQNAGNAPIQFFGVDTQDLVGYTKVKDAISSDDSVYAIVPLITDLTVTAMFKTDNETLADPNQSLSTGVPQKFRTVIGATSLTETTDLVSETPTATTEQLSLATPPGYKSLTISSLTALTSNLKPGDVVTVTASENTATLDGAYTIAHINTETNIETEEAVPVEVLSAEGLNYSITRPSTGVNVVPLVDNRATLTIEDVDYAASVAGITAGARTIAKVEDATTANGIHSIVEVTDTSTIINGNWASGSITAQDVVDALTTGSGVTVPFSGSVNISASTSTGATVQSAAVAAALSTGTAGVDDLASATTLDDVYIRLFDTAAGFLTAGVIAGDIIEIPNNPNGVFDLNTKQFVVGQVLSEQRLEIANISSGNYTNNTSTVENELPHTDNRLGTGTAVTQSSMRYRILRELTGDQQVTTLVSEAQSLNSRRAVLVWPDTVTVSGLVDNTNGDSATAVAQEGYYLGCAIGGMTAGLPSHQGFSRLGIAAVSGISNSGDLFTERQLTDISDGGLYVFKQNTPTSLPYSIHQLTTDPSTLESGEYSVVKNFDFVSLFFVDILEPFLGQWNINNDTLGFIRQALNTGIENLKLRRVAKIGAPINSATVTSVEVSDASADRVETYVEVDLPKPLNVIGLHLVA